MKKSVHNNTFSAWIDDCGGIVHKVARAYADTSAERDDLRQEILFAIWKAVPSFRQRCKVSTYVYRIALNRAFSYRRREADRSTQLAENAQAAEMAEASGKPDDRLELLYAEVRQLGELDRALLMMQLDGFTYREIAESVGMIARTRAEIREIRRGAPWLFATILVMFFAAKWQSIAAGREALHNEIATVFMVLALCTIGGTVLFHRLKAFLEPRLTQLESVRRRIVTL